MSKPNRKLAFPILGALCSVLLLGGFDGCNIYIYPYVGEPETQPEPMPEPGPAPEGEPDGPIWECFSDQDCPSGTVCQFSEDDECWTEPNCGSGDDADVDCYGLVAPCGYGTCVEVDDRCEDACFNNYNAFLEDCLGGMDGADQMPEPNDGCFERADEFLGQCLQSCGGPPPPPPPPYDCQDACFMDFEELLRECEQNGDQDCFQFAEENLNYCLMGCDEPPPPPDGCEDRCFLEFEDILRQCEQAGDDECYIFAEENLNFCLTHCDEPPPPNTCEDDCFVNFEALLQNCYDGSDPNGARPYPGECEQRAEEFLGQCLDSCDSPPPPPDGCEEECINNINRAFEECLAQGQDPQFCEDVILPLFEQCLQNCEGPTGDCDTDADCGPGQRCEIVEWCNGGEPINCDPATGECDAPVAPPECGSQGMCVVVEEPPPPDRCQDDADCGQGGACIVQEYCYFNCDVNDPSCCFEEGQCLYEDAQPGQP